MRNLVLLLACFALLITPSHAQKPCDVCVEEIPNQPVKIDLVASEETAPFPKALQVQNVTNETITSGFFVMYFPEVKDAGSVYGFGVGFDQTSTASNMTQVASLAPGASVVLPIPPEKYEKLANYLSHDGRTLSSIHKAKALVQTIKFDNGTAFNPGGYYPTRP